MLNHLTLSQFMNNSSHCLADDTTPVTGNYNLESELVIKRLTRSLSLCSLCRHQQLRSRVVTVHGLNSVMLAL